MTWGTVPPEERRAMIDAREVWQLLSALRNAADDLPDSAAGVEAHYVIDTLVRRIDALEVELSDAKENLAIAEDVANAYRNGAYLRESLADPWVRATVALEIDFREPRTPFEAWEAGMRGLMGTEVEVVL